MRIKIKRIFAIVALKGEGVGNATWLCETLCVCVREREETAFVFVCISGLR